MRVDRFLTLGLFQPVLRMRGDGDDRVPILMYHSVSDGCEQGMAAYYRTHTNPGQFRAQMMFLQQAGYRGTSLEEAWQHVRQPGRLGDRIVVITFDDGYRDVFTSAWPVLQKSGFTATVFLPTRFIQDRRQTFDGTERLLWEEVRELRKGGIRFGSHTVRHPKLYELSWPDIDRELADSKTAIEQKLGEPVLSFAYPFAFPQEDRRFASQFVALLKEKDYRCAVTTRIGRARFEAEPLCLPRLPVNSLDDRALLEAKLSGAYDWLSVLQMIVRVGKRHLRGSCRRPS